MIDTDNSGTISMDELKSAFEMTTKKDDELWEQVMLEVDQNKDGIISLEEFTAAMSKVVNDTYKDLQTITAPVLKKKKVTLTNKSDLLQ